MKNNYFLGFLISLLIIPTTSQSLLIFGSKTVPTAVDSTVFLCPVCRSRQLCEIKNLESYFTLFFISIFSYDSSSTKYVECSRCKSCFNAEILHDHDSTDYKGLIDIKKAIDSSDIELIKKITKYKSFTSNQKIKLLDYAQNVITKRNDNRFMLFVPELIGGILGIYFFCGGTMMYLNLLENRRNYFGLHFTALGAVILAILTARHNNQAKQCDDAIEIKQLINEMKTTTL